MPSANKLDQEKRVPTSESPTLFQNTGCLHMIGESHSDTHSTILGDLDQRLADLTVEPPRNTIDFVATTRQILQDISDSLEIPIIFASMTKSGRLVLPVWVAPRSLLKPLLVHLGFSEADEVASEQLNSLVTFMMVQKFRAGSSADLIEEWEKGEPEPKWLFTEIFRGRRWDFLSATRPADAKAKPLTSPTEAARVEGLEACLRRSEFLCHWVGSAANPASKTRFTAYTPWFGGTSEVAEIDPMDRLLLTPAFSPGHDKTAGLFVFPILGGAASKSDQELVDQISRFQLHLTVLAARINDQLRSQVTSANPRYCSRYFQVALGIALLPTFQKARHNTPMGMQMGLVLEAAKSLFDGRAHPIATRRILRNIPDAKLGESRLSNAGEFFGPLVGTEVIRRWFDMFGEEPLAPDTSPKAAEENDPDLRTTRVVATGSPRGGVGKTLLAYSLARMLAKLGQQVLLIELDAANPTIYFIDSDYRKKVHHLPGFDDMRKQFFDPVGGARSEASKPKKPVDAFMKWVCKLRSGLHVLGALPGIHDMAELLSAEASQGKDRRQIDALIAMIRKSGLYEWVIIDTGAGFRDLSSAAALSRELDLLVLCSFPTKPAILSMLVGMEVLRLNGVRAKQMLVLNECREMDMELFKDRECIADFSSYWMRNGGLTPDRSISSVGIIPEAQITAHISHLPAVGAVAWDDYIARLETDLELEELQGGEVGIKKLLADIAAATGDPYLPARDPSSMVEAKKRRR